MEPNRSVFVMAGTAGDCRGARGGNTESRQATSDRLLRHVVWAMPAAGKGARAGIVLQAC